MPARVVLFSWKAVATLGSVMVAMWADGMSTQQWGMATLLVTVAYGLWKDRQQRRVDAVNRAEDALKAEKRHQWDIDMRKQDRLDRDQDRDNRIKDNEDRVRRQLELKTEVRKVGEISTTNKNALQHEISASREELQQNTALTRENTILTKENSEINEAAIRAANHANEKYLQLAQIIVPEQLGAVSTVTLDTNETAHRIESKLEEIAVPEVPPIKQKG